MRVLVALAVVFLSLSSFSNEKPDFVWLVDHMGGVQVEGSEDLDIEENAYLETVLEAIAEVEKENLFHMVSSEICRAVNREVIRCDVVLKSKYGLSYRVVNEDGRNVVFSARLYVGY